MNSLYFECANGISGDMSVAALLDLGADRNKLERALTSFNLSKEFSFEIKEVMINSIKATDFNVIIKNNNETDTNHHQHKEHNHNHSHSHRNLNDINNIIDKIDADVKAKQLAKRIFQIVAEAEASVHNKNTEEIHFHEVGAVDSIADIVGFSVLFCDLNPDKVYFKTITEGSGSIKCAHGIMNVPVPAVCEIVSKYNIPLKLTDNDGEMITPTGAAIVAALYTKENLPETIIIKKTGNGAGKRPYPNPVLRVFQIDE